MNSKKVKTTNKKTSNKKGLFCGLCAVVMACCMGLSGCGNTINTIDLTPKAPDRIEVESVEILNTETKLKPGDYTLSAKVKPLSAEQSVEFVLLDAIDGVGITKNKITVGLTAPDKASFTVLARSTYDPSVASRISFTLDVPVIVGTPIRTADELRAIDASDESRTGSYILMNDIDLAPAGYVEGAEWDTAYDWEPIGLGEIQADSNDQIIRPANPFNGIINGNGYSVKNMRITKTKKQIEGNHEALWNGQILGFIAQLGAGAELKNIKIQGVINGGSWCGGLVGVNGGGKITNCISDVKLTTKKSAGALVNNNRAGAVKNCIAIGETHTLQSLNTDKHSAGLFVSSGVVENCFGDKEVMTTDNMASLNSPPTKDENFMLSTAKMQQRKTFAVFDDEVWSLRDGHYPELKNAENGGGAVEAFVGFDMEQEKFDVKFDTEAQLVVAVSGTKDTRVTFSLEGSPAGVTLNTETGLLTFTSAVEDFSDLYVTATLVSDPTKTARRKFKMQNDEYDTNGHKMNINSEEKLYRLIDEKSRFSNANVTLTADIALTTHTMWPGIGSPDVPFTGTFNGNGYKISGLKNSTNPLFGVIEAPTKETLSVTNLWVEGNVYKQGGAWLGGLVNYFKRGTISDCFVDVDVTGDYGLGGIAGLNSEETGAGRTVIKNCVSVGTLNANEGVIADVGWIANMHPRAGGIAGANSGTITNCYYDSSTVNAVPSGDDSVGLVVGQVQGGGAQTGAKTTTQLKSETVVTDLALANWRKVAGEYPKPPYVEPAEEKASVRFDMTQTAIDVKTTSTLQLVVVVTGSQDTRVTYALEGTPAGVTLNAETGLLTFTNSAVDSTNIVVKAALVSDPTVTASKTFVIQNDDYDTNGHKINIDTEEKLYRLVNESTRFRDANVTLTANITLSTYANWQGIGSLEAPFTGTFNGNGYKISGLNSTISPLFVAIESPTKETLSVTNLCVEGSVFKENGTWLGGLVKFFKRGTISDCFVDVDVTGDYGLGGIAGVNSEETATNRTVIKNCVSVGTLNANEGVKTGWLANLHPRAGGIVGANNGTITNCYYDSTTVNAVPAGDDSVGRVVGQAQGGGAQTGAKTTTQLKAETAVTDLALRGWRKVAGEYPKPPQD